MPTPVVSDGTLQALEQTLFGFNRDQTGTRALEEELVSCQQRVVELISMLQDSGRNNQFMLSEAQFASLQKLYPFLHSIEVNSRSNTLDLCCRNMPMYVALSNTALGGEWHGGTVYASRPCFAFNVQIAMQRSDRPHKFTNVTTAFPNPYPDFLADIGVPLFSYTPDHGSIAQMAHPHSSGYSRTFLSGCFGSNPFSGMFRRVPDNADKLLQALRYLLLWLETGNATDWYGHNITQDFIRTRDAAPVTTEIAQAVSLSFSKVYRAVKHLVETADTWISSTDIEALDEAQRNLEPHLYVDSNKRVVHTEVYALQRHMMYTVVYARSNDGFLPEPERAKCLRLLQIAYSSMLLAWLNADISTMTTRMHSPVIRNLLINDLIPREPAIEGHADPARILAAPAVLRAYMATQFGELPSWAAQYLPEEIPPATIGAH